MNNQPPTPNAALRGLTILSCLEFSVELDSGRCRLVLILTDDEVSPTKSIQVEFKGVSELCLKDFGGGLTQLLHLVITDISDRQLDRLNYQVNEVEKDSLSFLCQSFVITKIGQAES